jgi:hypothetical protein
LGEVPGNWLIRCRVGQETGVEEERQHDHGQQKKVTDQPIDAEPRCSRVPARRRVSLAAIIAIR